MKTELIKISQLKLLEKNPRRITKEQMDKLCRSIENDQNFLECRPVLVNCVLNEYETELKEGAKKVDKSIYYVYAGNQRVRAAKKLGMKEIPCIVEYDLEEDIVKKRIIQDNQHYGSWDFDELANCWDIETLIECGFKAEDLLGDLSNISDDPRASSDDNKKVESKCEMCGKKL